jgi:serine/threonine protein kinase
LTEHTLGDSEPGAEWDELLSPLVDRLREALAPDFEDLTLIGRGGMAFVFAGWDVQRKQKVALKVLPAELITNPHVISRFRREARIASSLEHPHILSVYEISSRPDFLFLTMNYMADGSLADRLGEPMEEGEILRILRAVAEALDYAHRAGVIHRDVKPGNILFDGSRPVLTDFGIARCGEQTRMTASNSFVGTPYYLSPEQALGKELDGRSDLYSLGAVGYQMATGRPPFEDPDPLTVAFKQVHEAVPSPQLFRPDLSDHLTWVLLKLLEKSPSARFAQASELLAALDPDCTATVEARRIPPAPARRRSPKRFAGPWPWLLLALVPLTALSVSFWLRRQPAHPIPLSASEEQGRPNLPPSTLEETVAAQQDLNQPPQAPNPQATIRVDKKGKKAKPLEHLGKLIEVEAGSFKMGSRTLLGKGEWQVHEVALSAFRLGEMEVSQALWTELMKENPSCEMNPQKPVTNVSRQQIDLFLQRLRTRTGIAFRLPTEAEWEYACKAGDRSFLNRASADEAWYKQNAEGRIQLCGQKKPNAWGLHDMQGNVWEWCSDYYQPDGYRASSYRDPQGPSQGEAFVVRGGSFLSDWRDLRSTARQGRHKDHSGCDLGIRLAAPANEGQQTPAN